MLRAHNLVIQLSQYQHEVPSSCNNTVYLSWLFHSEDVLGGNFTGKKKDLFESMNMINCGQRNVRKHKEIKGSDKCVTLNMYEILNISENFDDLDNMETTSSESKVKMEGS